MNLKNSNKEIIAQAEVGVIIGRFQTNHLHEGHLKLIADVMSHHKKVIILLGVKRSTHNRKNPLDFATRKAMLQELFPSAIILPIVDQRKDSTWSRLVDSTVSIPFGEKKTVIYGSRDSFIPSYSGKHPAIELEGCEDYNATNIRAEIAKEVLTSKDFRSGVIYQTFNQRPRVNPTVDIAVYNNNGEILLAKKPDEDQWRFIGGFYDIDLDNSWEDAAKREFREESGGNCEICNLRYILSHKVNDWRYQGEGDGIVTSMFLAQRHFGLATASDDIKDVIWMPIRDLSNWDGIRTKIMPEHREMMVALIDKIYAENTIPKIGERLEEKENVTYTIE
jgi:bifunctional NMN adenylyltransferase/nudix hydrolase